LEPVTHFLTGAVLARSGFNSKTALATATMTLAAEAPDLDVLWGLKGPVYGFAHHRGFTHSFAGLILVSALVTGFMYGAWRLRRRRTNIPGLRPRWGLLFLCAYIAGLSHILLDYTNNYGVRPFWPFSGTWYSWDIVFIFEPALYIILIGGLVLPAILRRNRPFPRGRRAAVVALASMAALYAARDHEHRRALGELAQKQFDGSPALRASAYPYFWHLFEWRAVAETPGSFVRANIDSRTGELNGLEHFLKPPETRATLVARRSYLGRVYLDWAEYPLVTETVDGADTAVHFNDLRFGLQALSATIQLNRDLEITAETVGRRSQTPPR